MSAREGWRRPATPHPDRPETWPVVWRVVAPGAGSYDNDMLFLETLNEEDARECCAEMCGKGYPMRLERVSCGPLPKAAKVSIRQLRATSPQNPGAKPRPVQGYWETRS